jgi:hypothetical protein
MVLNILSVSRVDGSEHIGTECVENIPLLSVSRVVFLAIYNKFLLMTDIFIDIVY